MAGILNVTLQNDIGAVQFRGDGQGAYQLMSPVGGLGLPSQRTSAFKLQGRDGEFVSQQFFSSRLIPIVARIKGISQAQVAHNVAEMYRLGVRRDGKTITSTVTLELQDGTSYTLECNIRRLDSKITKRKTKRPVTMLLQASDPNFYIGSDNQIYSFTKQAGTPGYQMPYTLPVTWGDTLGNSINLELQGEAIVYPIVEISGSGSNPVITNSTTDESLGFLLTLDDETLVIDMAKHTALIGNVSQISNFDFNTNNQWWALLPGINKIQLTSSGATDVLTARVKFRPAKIGV